MLFYHIFSVIKPDYTYLLIYKYFPSISKAILLFFPVHFLGLNTPRVKFVCISLAILQFVCLGIVAITDIRAGNCGFINAIGDQDFII